MKIIVTDVHEYLKKNDCNNREFFIGTIVDQNDRIEVSAHGRGTVCARNYSGGFLSGIYITCFSDDGYPL